MAGSGSPDILQAVAEGATDADGDPYLTYQYQWAKHDGSDYSGFKISSNITMQNTYPSPPATLTGDPAQPVYNSAISATAEGSTDADGDTPIGLCDGAAAGAVNHIKV